MLTIRNSQMAAMAASRPNEVMVQPCADDLHWIEFQLVDQDTNPVAGEPYRVRLSDQSVHMGKLDNDGKVRFDEIVAGQATICFTDMDQNEW